MAARWAVRGTVAGGSALAAYQFFKPVETKKDFMGQEKKRRIQRFNSLVDRGDDMRKFSTRAEHLSQLKSNEPFDMILVGGGCPGDGWIEPASHRSHRPPNGEELPGGQSSPRSPVDCLPASQTMHDCRSAVMYPASGSHGMGGTSASALTLGGDSSMWLVA